ncbi:MAG: zf-HC2 domain-containing protein [Rudaea sp.]
MSTRVVNLGSTSHRNAQDLLPWFVMGTLDADEHEEVCEHMRSCAACRRDLEWHRQLREAHNDPLPKRDVDGAFAALRARLPASVVTPVSAGGLRSIWQRWGFDRPFIGWALALQSVVIVGLASVLAFGYGKIGTDQSRLFHTLGRPAPTVAPARLVVVFAPQATQTEMRRVLLASETRIVDGPTAADAYILAVAPARAQHALQMLRAEPSVLLIQSLDAKDAH